MPKKEVDYSKTIIYKIVCNDLNIKDCYVGHTTNFIKRKSSHKNKSSKYNLNVYHFIRENGGWDNWTMIEIEKYPCKDSNEARTKERYWYEELKANLNMCKPIMTKEEHYNYQTQYHQEHKEEQKIKSKEYYEEHKINKIEYQKQYQRENKKTYNDYHKQYRKLNKDKINERRQISRLKLKSLILDEIFTI
jgi:hypothetical protein